MLFYSCILHMDLLSQLMNVHHDGMCRKATNVWWECNMAVVLSMIAWQALVGCGGPHNCDILERDVWFHFFQSKMCQVPCSEPPNFGIFCYTENSDHICLPLAMMAIIWLGFLFLAFFCVFSVFFVSLFNLWSQTWPKQGEPVCLFWFWLQILAWFPPAIWVETYYLSEPIVYADRHRCMLESRS